MKRRAVIAGLLASGASPALAQGLSEGAMTEATQAGLEAWVMDFRPRALAAGIDALVFDSAMTGVRLDPAILEKDRNQAEFTKAIWDYLDTAVSEQRIAAGRAALDRRVDLLARIEAAHGVEREVVVAIWGLESAFGTFRGDVPVVDALATLAYDGRRRAFFEGQLIAALRILQTGETDLPSLRGSWAGAMGHTQFMPTSWLETAIDFDGDGRRDIWGDDPADALASAAAYLAKAGWTRGMPWGVEVVLPEAFDYGQTGERIRKSVAEWRALGLRAVEGTLPDHGSGSVLLPAGARGAAFLIFANFHAIERYNTADAYVIAVGHLSDRLRGGGPIRAAWPREDRVLRLDERIELQTRLAAQGFDPGAVDGKIGPNTIAAVRAFQRTQGLVPDGYASLEVLRLLQRG